MSKKGKLITFDGGFHKEDKVQKRMTREAVGFEEIYGVKLNGLKR